MKEKLKSPLQTNGGAGYPFLSFLCPGRQEAEVDFTASRNRPSRYISRSAVNVETVDFEELFDFYSENRIWREILRKFQMDLERLKRMDLYAAVNYIRRGNGV